MSYTYHELKEKTVAELREIAKSIEHEAVQGYSQLNKEHLLKALCIALKIDTKEHHVAVGVDKAKIKREIAQLKKRRDEIAGQKDNREEMRHIKRQIHRLKRELRKAIKG